MEINLLQALGERFQTDKAKHNFLRFYDQYFSQFRDQDIRFLEIGIFFGASLKMWRQYFKRAIIDCADRDTNLFNHVPENVNCFKIDQKNPESLINFYNLKSRHGYDIILDDGNHTVFSNQLTFKCLWPLIKPSGIYVIEDVHTSLDVESYNSDMCSHTTLEFAKSLIDKTAFESTVVVNGVQTQLIDKSFFRSVLSQISDVNLYQGTQNSYTLLIKKT